MHGQNLPVTPGVYAIDKTMEAQRADTVTLGIGITTLTAMRGAVVMAVTTFRACTSPASRSMRA